MANRITLKDDHYRIIGFVDIDSKGKKTLMNANYKILGYYDPVSNTTRALVGGIVGHGDILTTLLTND